MSRLENRSHILFPSQRNTKRCQQLWKEKRNQCFSGDVEGKQCMHSSLGSDFCGQEGLLSKDVPWMDGNGAFLPSIDPMENIHEGKTNAVLIMPLKSQMVAFHDIYDVSVTGMLFMVFLVALEGFEV